MTTFRDAQANLHYKRDLICDWLARERPELAALAVACWLVEVGNDARARQMLIDGSGPFDSAPSPDRDTMRAALAELYT